MNLGIILSLFFCGYIISLLIKEQYEVFFAYGDKFENQEAVRVYTCFKLDDIKFDRSFYRNESAVSLDGLVAEIRKVFLNLSEENYHGFNELQSSEVVVDIVLQAIEKKNYYFHNYRFCIISSYAVGVNLTALIGSRRVRHMAADTPYRFLYYYGANLKVRYQIVQNQGPPFFECRRYADSRTKKRYSRFLLINECLAKSRSLKYFYPGNDSGTVDLRDTGSSLKSEEIKCFDAYPTSECLMAFITQVGTNEPDNPRFEAEVLISYPRLERLDFWLQLAMLICLFINASLLETVLGLIRKLEIPKAVRKLLERFRQATSIYPSAFSIRVLLVLLSILFLLAIYYKKISAFDQKLRRPHKRWILNFTSEFEPISLAICLPIDLDDSLLQNPTDSLSQNSIDNETQNSTHNEWQNFTDHQLQNPTSQWQNLTLAQLERRTDGLFRDQIEEIYLAHQNKKEKVLWSLSEDVYFYFSNSFFSRCFRVQIENVLEPKYQALLSISRLMIKTGATNLMLFLIPEGEEFVSNTYKWNSSETYVQRTVRWNHKCIDYRWVFNYTRTQLLDQCKLNEFYRHQSAIWLRVVVNKRYLTERQWQEGVLSFSSVHRLSPRLREAHQDCEKQYAAESCKESLFKSDNREISQMAHLKAINLWYKKENVFEEEESIYELIFELVSIQGIFIGINAMKLFVGAFAAVRFVCRIKPEKIRRFFRIYRHLVYVLCFVGFVGHSAHFLNEVLNGDYVYSQSYEELRTIDSADHIFCFDFNVSLVDSNHRLTGSYLEEVTSDLTLGKFFEKIEYLNPEDEWVVLEHESVSRNDGKYYSVRQGFFQHLKCFHIKINLEYQRRRFFYVDELSVLNVYFSDKFLEEERNLYFISKKRGRIDVSPMITLDSRLSATVGYKIRQELFEIQLNDKLNFVKNPLSAFRESTSWRDVSNYISRLINGFRHKYSYLTTNMFVSEHMELEVKNELFEQFYLQVQNVTDQNAPKNYNFERLFIINYFKHKPLYPQNNSSHLENQVLCPRNQTRPNLQFVPLFWKRELQITSQHSYPTLVLACLNLLCFWMNVDIISTLDTHLPKLRTPFLVIYLLLHKLKTTFNPF